MNSKILKGMFLLLNLISCFSHAKTVIVTDDSGAAINNANILIEYSRGEDSTHFITDENGQAVINLKSTGAFNLRVNKAGYLPLNVNLRTWNDPIEITLSRKSKPNNFVEVVGETNGYPSLQQDGWIDFSLVLSTLDRKELIAFNMGTLISPETDIVSVMGNDIEVPSNVSIPQQTENYFFTLTFNKPEFRFYVPQAPTTQLFAVHGKMPLNKMVNDYQDDKTFFEMLNNVDFLSLGEKNVKTNKDIKNIAITTAQTDLEKKLTVKSPKFDSDKVMISVAAFNEGGSYYLTDIKKVEVQSESNLMTKKADSYVISLLLNDAKKRNFDQDLLMFESSNLVRVNKYDFNQVSYHIQRGSSVTPVFLPLVAAPAFDESAQKLNAKAPIKLKGVNEYATVVNLYRVISVSDQFSVEQRELLFSKEFANWSEKLDLSGNNFKFTKGETYAWEVMYLGSETETFNAKISWNAITHVSRNSRNFKQ